MERSLRIHENYLVDRVEAWCAGDCFALTPGQAVLHVVLLRAFWQFMLYVVCYALLFCLIAVLSARQAPAATVDTELAHAVRGGPDGRGTFVANPTRVHGVGLQPGSLGPAYLGRTEKPALRARDTVLPVLHAPFCPIRRDKAEPPAGPVLDMRKKSPYKWGDALVAQLDRAIAS